jgi:hypothetical protein
MPTWLRKFYIKQIQKVKETEKAEYDKAKGGNSGQISRPNISRPGVPSQSPRKP